MSGNASPGDTEAGAALVAQTTFVGMGSTTLNTPRLFSYKPEVSPTLTLGGSAGLSP